MQHQSKEDLSGKEELLKQYIGERTKDKIPVEISFGYPSKWVFDELRMVDSPGVNALGGVQDISFRFFEKANAILFIHPIEPVESRPFREFVESVISNRSKETLFLVLTHTGLYSNSDIKRLHSEAVRLYRDIVPEERIICVDSLLKLIYDDMEGGKTLEQIEESSEQKSDILPKFERKAERENKSLKNVLLEYSRFGEMFDAVDKFSMQAPNLQLQEILESIKKGYEDQNNQYEDKLGRLNKKKKYPQEFEKEIERITNLLSDYRRRTSETREELAQKYSGRNSEWIKKIKSINVILKILKSPNRNKTEYKLLRKNFEDYINEMNDIINSYSIFLKRTLSERLKEIGKGFKSRYNINVPKVDRVSITKQSVKEAEEKIVDTRHWWDKVADFFLRRNRTAGKRSAYVFEKLEKEFLTYAQKIQSEAEKIYKNYLESFSEEMNAAIKERQEDLQKEKDKKQSNDEILAEIDNLKIKKNEIQPQLRRVEEIMEDLK